MRSQTTAASAQRNLYQGTQSCVTAFAVPVGVGICESWCCPCSPGVASHLVAIQLSPCLGCVQHPGLCRSWAAEPTLCCWGAEGTDTNQIHCHTQKPQCWGLGKWRHPPPHVHRFVSLPICLPWISGSWFELPSDLLCPNSSRLWLCSWSCLAPWARRGPGTEQGWGQEEILRLGWAEPAKLCGRIAAGLLPVSPVPVVPQDPSMWAWARLALAQSHLTASPRARRSSQNCISVFLNAGESSDCWWPSARNFQREEWF